MSVTRTVLKKMRRAVKREKAAYVNQIARELLTQTFWARVRMAWRIVKG